MGHRVRRRIPVSRELSLSTSTVVECCHVLAVHAFAACADSVLILFALQVLSSIHPVLGDSVWRQRCWLLRR